MMRRPVGPGRESWAPALSWHLQKAARAHKQLLKCSPTHPTTSSSFSSLIHRFPARLQAAGPGAACVLSRDANHGPDGDGHARSPAGHPGVLGDAARQDLSSQLLQTQPHLQVRMIAVEGKRCDSSGSFLKPLTLDPWRPAGSFKRTIRKTPSPCSPATSITCWNISCTNSVLGYVGKEWSAMHG